MVLTTTQAAVLRIIVASISMYTGFKFFFARSGGPSQGLKSAYVLAIILAALMGYRAAGRIAASPARK
jgi:hypothetical protein